MCVFVCICMYVYFFRVCLWLFVCVNVHTHVNKYVGMPIWKQSCITHACAGFAKVRAGRLCEVRFVSLDRSLLLPIHLYFSLFFSPLFCIYLLPAVKALSPPLAFYCSSPFIDLVLPQVHLFLSCSLPSKIHPVLSSVQYSYIPLCRSLSDLYSLALVKLGPRVVKFIFIVFVHFPFFLFLPISPFFYVFLSPPSYFFLLSFFSYCFIPPFIRLEYSFRL